MSEMRVHVVLPARAEREVEVPASSTGIDLVRALGLAPDVHLILRGDLPVPLDAPLREGESLRILGVVSGGSA
jgi:sulfur carrier protein ThiS